MRETSYSKLNLFKNIYRPIKKCTNEEPISEII